MAKVNRILVPTDFSPTSDVALGYANQLAEKLGATVHLVHALEDPYTAAAFAAEAYSTLPAALRQDLIREAQRQLAERLATTGAPERRGTAEVVSGHPSRVIVEYASGLGADLIVIGTHGRSGVPHLLLGSVAERVVRTAPCPVVTIRDAPAGHTGRMLVATDFSPTSDEALDYARTLAGHLGATITLLHVIRDPFIAEGFSAEAYIAEAPTVRTALLDDARKRLAHRAGAVANGPAIETEAVFGDGPKTIADYAATRGFDVLVTGTHGRTGIAHLLIGSVAERLVRMAPCPVLTVKHPKARRELSELIWEVDHLPA
jgi:nucleotide-binding universal stress UspA family protein